MIPSKLLRQGADESPGSVQCKSIIYNLILRDAKILLLSSEFYLFPLYTLFSRLMKVKKERKN